MKDMRVRRALVGCLALAIALSTGAAWAGVSGVIYKTDGGTAKGSLAYKRTSKSYSVTTSSGVRMEIPLSKVERVRVAKPSGIDNAINDARRGSGTAIPVLEKIMNSYYMLQWDVVAARWLAHAYLQKDNAKQAVEMCEKVIAANRSAAWDPDLAAVYWDALLRTQQHAKLRRALTDAIGHGNRTVAAIAQIKRGDMDKDKGNLREALLDGYLRTVVLYQQVKSVQAEALYKAATCFKELGQHSYAEKMRKKMLADYPDSPYTKRIRSGS